jgi:hypothetical protein
MVPRWDMNMTDLMSSLRESIEVTIEIQGLERQIAAVSIMCFSQPR